MKSNKFPIWNRGYYFIYKNLKNKVLTTFFQKCDLIWHTILKQGDHPIFSKKLIWFLFRIVQNLILNRSKFIFWCEILEFELLWFLAKRTLFEIPFFPLIPISFKWQWSISFSINLIWFETHKIYDFKSWIW